MKTIMNLIFGFAIVLAPFVEGHTQSRQNASSVFNKKQKSLITIVSYTAQGDLECLESALNTGLDNGLTVNEIKEAIVHLYAYAGFPRSIRGLQTFMKVLDERKAKGINDKQGPKASPISDERDKYERGQETLYELTGTKWEKPKSGYGAFSPAIDRFLKEHLFTDIFERNVLNYQQRELVTISVLSAIGGVEPMLQSHMNICLHVGLTPNQLQQFVDIIQPTLSKKEAKAARKVLDKVLEDKFKGNERSRREKPKRLKY